MFNLFKKNKTISLLAPMTGDIIKLEEVPDEVFAQKMVGDGIAIKPTEGIVVSPCSGKVIQIFPTKHAIGIETKENIEILIHVGLDTVNLKGEGFKTFVSEGEKIKAGDKILEVDLDYIENNAKSTITPIIITNMDKLKNLTTMEGTVEKGKDNIMEIEPS